VIQKEFARQFAQALHRPAFFGMPEFMVKSVFGEMSHLFLDSQRVLPKQLLKAGFAFRQPELAQALVRT
jgi:NAD dependent epimerase/dehydratase family enzyme